MKTKLTAWLTIAGLSVLCIFAARGATTLYKQVVLGQELTWSTSKDRAGQSGPAMSVPDQNSTRSDASGPKADQAVVARRIVAQVSNGQSKVLAVFTGLQGATGVVVQGSTGNKFIGWVAPGVEALFVGASFGADGRNVTQEEMVGRGLAAPVAGTVNPAAEPGAPLDPAAVARNIFVALEKSYSFVEGTEGPMVYAFSDLNCPSCSQFWQSARQPIAAGKLRVRWIPVAILGSTSEGKAASLMTSPNPALTYTQHEAKIGPPLANIKPDERTHNALEANTALLNLVTQGQMATPVLISKGTDGKSVTSRGLPNDLAAYFAQAK